MHLLVELKRVARGKEMWQTQLLSQWFSKTWSCHSGWWKGPEWIFPAGGSCEALLGCRTAGNSVNNREVFFWVGNLSFRINSKQFLAEPLPEKPFKGSENTLTSLVLHRIIKDMRL